MKHLIFLVVLFAFLANGCSLYNPENNLPSASSDSDPMETTIIDEQEYYLVKTEDALVSIGESYPLSGNYRLDNNITLTKEWKAIGNEKAPFTGVFDGNGYVIYGLDRNRGK